MTVGLRLVVLTMLLVTAVAWDVSRRRIPNFLTVPAAAIGLILWSIEVWPKGILTSVSGFAVGLGLFLVPFAMGGLGAGDVKLAAAIGALMGPRFTLAACLYGALAGGVISAFQLARRGRLISTLRTLLWNVAAVFSPRIPFTPVPKLSDSKNQAASSAGRADAAFPYGVAIALGVLSVILLQ